jgi:hypothetical protein
MQNDEKFDFDCSSRDEPQDVVAKRRPGGQPGNSNRFKSGCYSKRNRALRRDVAALRRNVRMALMLAEAAARIPEPA